MPQPGKSRLEFVVIMVMGAVAVVTVIFIFKSVERSAGNAKAMAKLLAFRQVIEEYASRTQSYPTPSQARTVWAREREKDYLLSPWGGPVGPELADASTTRGISGETFFDIENRRAAGRGRAGGIGYMLSTQAEQTARLYDVTANRTAVVRNYGCFYYDPEGIYPHFSTGGSVPGAN